MQKMVGIYPLIFLIEQQIINNSVNRKQHMQQKQRPFSSKPATKIPIIVDQSYVESQVSQKGFQLASQPSKMKLNQIIPQLPAFGIKSNSTALLYSKFIVKGLKQDKLSVVKSALKKKQEITEAGTTLYNNKSRISHKNVKQGKSVTGAQTVQMHETFPIEQNQMNQRNGIQNKQLHNLLRASSAKVFRKINNRQTIVQNQRILVKNSTQANLHKQNRKRPTTAKPTKQKDLRLSQGLPSQEPRLFIKKQVKNGAHQNVRNIFSPTLDQLDPLISKKLLQKPLKVQSNYNRDHIERNIQNISTYTRKTSSIYLTNANIQNLLIKKSQQKLKRQQRVEQQNKNNSSNILQPKQQQLFTKTDKSTHQNKLYQIQKYLKQSSPTKYHLLTSEIRNQQKKNKLQISQHYDELLSKDIDHGDEHFLIKSQTQINEKGAISCYEEYIQNCEVLQYNISTKLKTQQINNNNNTTLNICECQQIISIYRKIIQTQIKTKKQQYIQKIRKITKSLKYFADKPQKEIDKFFTLPFEIVIADQGQQIIQLNSPVNHIYIILNGSVIVQSNTNNDKQPFSKDLMAQNIFNTHHSLYDGQGFGQPSKPSQRYYKNRVTTLQQSLLLKVKYEDYIRQFFQGSEIEQKLQVLNLAFKMEINSGIFYEQDLQMLSLSLEKHRFASKSLIFRQGEIFEKLIFVAKGKLCSINEFILTQDKLKIQDMKQIDKNIRQPKQQNILANSKTRQKHTIQKALLPQQFQTDFTIQRMRRQNLINYQILRQDLNKITYYFIKQQTTYVKGDILNWQSIIPSSPNPTNNNFVQQGKQKQYSLTPKPLRYSLISNSDETEIYFLTKTAYEYLPSNIKKILSQKGKQKCKKEQKIETEKEIKQWNNYKNKLCNRIIKQHKERNKSKHRF